MDIVAAYVQEQKRYSKNDLRQLLKHDEDDINRFIVNLKAFGILKVVKNNSHQLNINDLVDEDLVLYDIDGNSNDSLYVFTFVGIITVGSRVLISYPKYIKTEDRIIPKMKQVLKVLEKCNSKDEVVHDMSGNGETDNFNLLGVIKNLINDYMENGLYSNNQDIIETNGQGTINWDKTINESFALISNNKPYYVEYFTNKTVEDDLDYFRRLHGYILTDASCILTSANLTELLDIEELNLSEENIDVFGDAEYILDKIYKELNIQYNTRKQMLLKTMYAYIYHKKTMMTDNSISLYGSSKFNLVWEFVCSSVFDNKLRTKLSYLDLPIDLRSQYNRNQRLIDIIEKPSWIGYKPEGEYFEKESKDTLEPDIISILVNKEDSQMVILDAKYYDIHFREDKRLSGYPLIGDVTKQFFYALSYKEFANQHNFKAMRNCFLMPTDSKCMIKIGKVHMEMFSRIDLSDIEIRLLPTESIYKVFLSQQTFDIEYLELKE